MDSQASTIVGQKYVSFTSFRRNGEAVATPVWIAPLDGGRAGFTTGADSGKVKRIGHTPTVTLQGCTMRGAIDASSPVVRATAEFVTGERAAVVEAAIRRKYGIMAAMLALGGALRRLVGRGEDPAAIIVTFDPAD